MNKSSIYNHNILSNFLWVSISKKKMNHISQYIIIFIKPKQYFFCPTLTCKIFFFKFLRSKLSQIAYLSLSTVKCWNNKISGHCTSFLMIDRQYVDVKSFISLHCWNAARPKKRIYFYTKLRTISTEKWKKITVGLYPLMFTMI